VKERLVIELSEEATEAYLVKAGNNSNAELEANVEPSGATLAVEIGSVFSYVSLLSTGEDLGECDIYLCKEEV